MWTSPLRAYLTSSPMVLRLDEREQVLVDLVLVRGRHAMRRAGIDLEGREVVGIRVHLVAAPRLARPAVPAAIMRDAPIAPGGQEEHLVLPGVRAERPPVAEDDGLPRAPVLVVDLRAVLRRDGRHGRAPFRLSCS